MGMEQRKYERKDVEFILKYRLHGKDGNFEYAYYQNISLGGILIIEIEKQVPSDTLVDIELSMPYTPDTALMNSLRLLGRVVYCHENKTKMRKFDCGVAFIDLNQSQREMLDKFLKFIRKT